MNRDSGINFTVKWYVSTVRVQFASRTSFPYSSFVCKKSNLKRKLMTKERFANFSLLPDIPYTFEASNHILLTLASMLCLFRSSLV